MKYLLLSLLIAISFTSKAQTYKPKDIKDKPKLRAFLVNKTTNEKQYVLLTKIKKNFYYWHDSLFVKLDTMKWRIQDTLSYHPQDTTIDRRSFKNKQ